MAFMDKTLTDNLAGVFAWELADWLFVVVTAEVVEVKVVAGIETVEIVGVDVATNGI